MHHQHTYQFHNIICPPVAPGNAGAEQVNGILLLTIDTCSTIKQVIITAIQLYPLAGVC